MSKLKTTSIQNDPLSFEEELDNYEKAKTKLSSVSNPIDSLDYSSDISSEEGGSKNFKKSNLLRFGLIALSLVLLFSVLGYYNNKTSENIDDSSLLSTLSKVIILPNEEPSVITLTEDNKNELIKKYNHFTNSKIDDKLLIFKDAKKGILYRPSDSLIVEVVGLEFTNTANPRTTARSVTPSVNTATAKNPEVTDANPTKKETPVEKKIVQKLTNISVVLLNGTTINGLTLKADPILAKSLKTHKVSVRDNAAVQTYKKSVVVYLAPEYKEAAENLAKEMGVTAQKVVPSTQPKPTAGNILVILGPEVSNL